MTPGPERPASPGDGRPRPRVSVAFITYRQERFVARAIEAVLAQRADFPIELVIGEDRSPDGTRAIVADLARRHPDCIRLLETPEHLGMIRNFVRTLGACRGDYVALLEGDDYWTDPDKLRKQVAFLDRHPESAACFHDAEVRHEDGGRAAHPYCPPDLPAALAIEDLLVANVIPTCSAMIRFACLPEFPKPYFTFGFGDWPLHVLVARHGSYGYLRETMAVYRVHSGGVWATMPDIRRRRETIRIYGYLDRWLDGEHRGLIQALLAEQHYRLAVLHEQAHARRAAAAEALAGLRTRALNPLVPPRRWLGLWLRLALPREPQWAAGLRARAWAAIHPNGSS